ncbi:MAG: exonuclease domain-containing protein [Sulfurimonadaceae bacterium]|nr:exonuclease domain-containing protein [Sulfurimonadaceae bacterium]
MLIFLDLETTGLEEDAKICAIAIIAVEAEKIKEVLYEFINEGKKIPPNASAIHHITNEMIHGMSSFKESKSYKFLEANNNPNATIIVHNAKFDKERLRTSGYEFLGEFIDTLRVTKHLIPECGFFSLQFLRYELKLYKQEKQAALACNYEKAIEAHNAFGDVLVTKLLYEYLLEIADKEKMQALSKQHVLVQLLPFGKYEGQYIEEIASCDRGYLEWIIANITDLDDDLRYSIDYYLRGNL